MLKLTSLISALLLISTLQAQEFNTALMDSFLLHLYQNDKSMGSLAVMKGDQLVYARAVGMSDIENQITATKDTRYKIGSISKTFTATMIMQLIDAKKLTLETPLSQYYPDVKNAEKITIRHLLSHRTGIPEYLKEVNALQLATLISKENLVERIEGYDSDFEPDAKYVYSNSNYFLLGAMAETISGLSYEALLQNLIGDLEMPTTQSGQQTKTHAEATSYGWLTTWEKIPAWHMSWAFGAGEITSTASEVAHYMHALQSGKILSEASTAEMKKMNEGYGLGLFTVPYGKYSGYGHNGRIENFESSAYHFPDLDLTFSYLSNGLSIPYNDVLLGILGISINNELDFPDFTPKETVELTKEQLTTFEGEYKSATFPLDIKVFMSEATLMAQATGQGAFPLTPVGESEFTFEPAGINLLFDAAENTVKLSQSGMVNVFKR